VLDLHFDMETTCGDPHELPEGGTHCLVWFCI